MAEQPSAPVKATRNRWLIPAAIVLVVALVAGFAYLRHRANEEKATELARRSQLDPGVLQQRAVEEARATLNIELLRDDGTFFPATPDIEVGSLLYTVHVLGPAKQRYYSEDAYFAGREGDRVIVRPIIGKQRAADAPPQNYRNQQSRSAETKREEVKAQKKLTREELAEKYAARASR
jgi:hypothetical protein